MEMIDDSNSDSIMKVWHGRISSCEKSFNIGQNAFLFHLSGVMNIIYLFSKRRLLLTTYRSGRCTLCWFWSTLDWYHDIGRICSVHFLDILFLNLSFIHEWVLDLRLRIQLLHDTFQGLNMLLFFLYGHFSFIKLVSDFIKLIE